MEEQALPAKQKQIELGWEQHSRGEQTIASAARNDGKTVIFFGKRN